MPAVLVATLIYLGILVAVLAVGLILIAWRLSATARALRRIRDSLAQVSDNTAPLAGALEGVNGALGQLAVGLKGVHSKLVRADGVLERIIRKVSASAA